ncbi:NUDIX domain-containing protein [Nocardioides guangzhouensis]|uniref:NUDIX domain-containing protein n=1 Tax=Nocardioides guangzhouensis TaxID=2497878 RepID=A0A4Q4Z0T8_9ACTN|nr:NUDIX domain-containing protein [Nocardioides guangzhouensis]RYP81153.1 NUDIX domain-containing protein [Nocardioides guangzhouensis]
MARLPQRQRVAAYAVVLRDDRILLSRLDPRIARGELWTLPGGGLDHGEDPHQAVVREIHEETGLDARVSDAARIYSMHNPRAQHGEWPADYHALRIVFEGWVPVDAPEPRVVEVDGSTVESAWVPLADVHSGTVPVTDLVKEALRDHQPFQRQRLAAYALVRRPGPAGEQVLLVRISRLGAHAGSWTLPGGGVDHGEKPAVALSREVQEECGVPCVVGDLLGVHDVHFTGTAPTGRQEDFHGIHLVFAATVPEGAEPSAVEVDGTTDAVAWVPVADVGSGAIDALDVVRHALSL